MKTIKPKIVKRLETFPKALRLSRMFLRSTKCTTHLRLNITNL